jgi:hypothetical protein
MFNWFKKPKAQDMGPDWSHVDSIDKARKLATAGQLTRLQLLPDVFGGADLPENSVYVPSFVAEIKADIDNNTVMDLVEQGMVQRYVASPRYQGKSVIPIAIAIEATEPANFRAEIKIWGAALEESEPAKHYTKS